LVSQVHETSGSVEDCSVTLSRRQGGSMGDGDIAWHSLLQTLRALPDQLQAEHDRLLGPSDASKRKTQQDSPLPATMPQESARGSSTSTAHNPPEPLEPTSPLKSAFNGGRLRNPGTIQLDAPENTQIVSYEEAGQGSQNNSLAFQTPRSMFGLRQQDSRASSFFQSTIEDMHHVVDLQPRQEWLAIVQTSSQDRYGKREWTVAPPAKSHSVHTDDSFMQRFVCHPSSAGRLGWDLLGMVLLFYDLITVPLQFFGDKYVNMNSNALLGFSIITSIYWTADIVASFLVGFHMKGLVEMSFKVIAARYMRTWFWLDITLATTDWAFISLGFASQASYMRIGKTLSRGVRVLRLLRILKMHVVVADLVHNLQSEYTRIFFSMGSHVMLILFINHFIACGWYGITHFKEENWVNFFLREERGLGYRYATSLHWSLTQFTPASMEVVPQNEIERVYSVCVLVFAMVTFSSFISSITQAMSSLRSINTRRIEQEALLRRYLGQHSISVALVNRVWHYLHQPEVVNLGNFRCKEQDVQMLELLPASMRSELRVEAFAPLLREHPFFLHYSIEDPGGLSAICNNCLMEISLLAGQELFSPTDAKFQEEAMSPKMFFVSEGCIEYYLNCLCGEHEAPMDPSILQKMGMGGAQNNPRLAAGAAASGRTLADLESAARCAASLDRIEPGRWAGEAFLWSTFKEVPTPFVATLQSELLLVNGDSLMTVVRSQKRTAKQVMDYARTFTECIDLITTCRWRIPIANDHSAVEDIVHKVYDFRNGMEGGKQAYHKTRKNRTSVRAPDTPVGATEPGRRNGNNVSVYMNRSTSFSASSSGSGSLATASASHLSAHSRLAKMSDVLPVENCGCCSCNADDVQAPGKMPESPTSSS